MIIDLGLYSLRSCIDLVMVLMSSFMGEADHVCTLYPPKLFNQWDAPSKTRPGPSQSSYLRLMAPARGWPEGGMREVAQNP